MEPPSHRLTRAARLCDPSALCSCHTSSMPTPAGEITVVRVFGDVDTNTEHVLRAALAEARGRRPSHLVVDVAGLSFCSVRGLALMVDAATFLSGAAPHIERFLNLLWSADALPSRYPSVGAAVLAAMADQRTSYRLGSATPHPSRPTAGSRIQVVADADGADAGLSDDELIGRARGGDGDAYRELARRHRLRVYRGAMRMLGESESSEDGTQDIETRLRTALAAFDQGDPP